MELMYVLKAIADDTRMGIIRLLMRYNYCVRALAKELGLSESTISQHLKVLREAGLISGKKCGYFMHYDVQREVLRELTERIGAISEEADTHCTPSAADCAYARQETCRAKKCKRSNEEAVFVLTESGK